MQLKRLVQFCAIFLICTFAAAAQTQHGRIVAEGQSKFQSIINTTTVALVGSTPSVALGNVFRTANGGTTTITNFTGGSDTQKITVTCGDTATTIQNNSNIVTTSQADIPCLASGQPTEFVYSLADAKWYQVSGGGGGGGGSAPGGVNGDNQIKNGSLFAGGHLNDDGTRIYESIDVMPRGPNPWIDVRAYGVRSMGNGVPALAGMTANTTSGSPNVTVSTSFCGSQVNNTCFLNGEAVAIYGAGPTNSTATPSAPTVTPSLNAAETGSLLDVNGPVGATTYSYVIAAIRPGRGITPASTVGSTTMGAASLGVQTNNFSSVTMANNLVTVTTSAAHGLVPGAAIIVSGVTPSSTVVSNPFNGWFIVNSSADNTHFTYLVNSDTRNLASTSGTGGTVTYHNVNHITWNAVSGAFAYAIWRTAPSPALIGISWPQNAFFAGDATYLAFDDYGSPVTTLPNPPPYVPSTPPSVATNDMLVSTIVSGAGTTSLVLAANAGQTVNGASILIDHALNALTAATAARAANTSLKFPPGAYYFNSPQTFPSGLAVLQEGSIVVNETQTLSGVTWAGNINAGATPSFSYAPYPTIFVGKAYPGLYSSGSNFYLYNLNITNQNSNGSTMVIADTGQIPASIIDHVSFSVSGGAGDYSNIGLLFRGGTHVEAASVANLNYVLFLSNQNGNLTGTFPAFYADNFGNLQARCIFLSGKGLLVRGTVSGISLDVDGFYSQGNYTPLVAFTNAQGGGTAGAIAKFSNVTLDTTLLPIIANLGGMSLDVQLDYISGSGSYGSVTGVPTTRLNAGLSAGAPGPGQSIGTQSWSTPAVFDGNFSNPSSPSNTPVLVTQVIQNASIALGPAYDFFAQDSPSPAPTCVTNAAGPPFTIAGTWTFKYAYEYANLGVGNSSPASSSCTANGTTQQIVVTLPSTPFAVGAIGTMVFVSNGAGYVMIGGFAPITTTSYTFTSSFFNGNAPINGGSGPAGFRSGNLWATNVSIGATAISAANNTAARSVSLPDAAGTIGLLGGSFTNSDCLKANVSGGVTTITSLGLACALTTSPLSQFASTTSAQLAGVLSDETGSGLAVFNNAPALTSPTVSTTLVMAASAELRFLNGANYVGFKAPASLGSNIVFALPQTDSTGTQCLSSNGSLALAWSTCSGGTGTPGGSPSNIQYSNGSFAGSPALVYNGTDTVGIGLLNTTLGKLQMFGNTSGSAIIQTLAVAGTPTLTLPNTTGTLADGASSPLVLSATTGNLTCPTCTTNASALTANAIVLGGGLQATVALGSLGTTTTVLHGNAAGAPSFSAVVLTTDVSGALPYANGGSAQASRQAAINGFLPGANGDIFYRDLSGNVVSLAAVSSGSCLLSGTIPAWGSCSSGSITGAGSAGQLTVWNTSSSLTSSANFTYAAGVLNENQSANGLDTFTGKRFTDTSPTGTLIKFTNAAANATIFQVDVTGAVNAASFNASSTVAGFAGLGQGTAQGIVGNTVGLTAPTSVTGYNIVFPAAAGTGSLRATNAAGIVTLSYVSASGIGSCTNQVLVAVNDNTGPTCAPVSGPLFGTQAANLVWAGPGSGAAAFPTFRGLVSADIPPINLSTNGAQGGVTALLGYINGGCNATSASACFNGIYPGTVAGDIVFEQSAGVAARLPAGTTSQVLIGGSAPSWGALNLASMTTGTLGIPSGGSGQVTANAALNAFLPSQGGNAGTCLGTNGTNSNWVTCGGGGSTVTPHPNFGASFSGATTTTITGASHLMGTKNLVLSCFDNSSPAKAINPASWTVDGSTFDVVVNFAVAATGYCVVNGSGPNRFASNFTTVTSVTVTGATHKLATADLEVTVWDNSSPRKKIIPASVTVDTSSFDVVVTFGASQSGRIVIQ